MTRPPKWFVNSLAILDPLLRVRWSDVSAQWVIDRKAVLTVREVQGLTRREAGLYRSLSNLPVDSKPNLLHQRRMKWMDVKDELDSALEVRKIILKTTALSQEIYNSLCKSDLVKYGGYSRFADDLEAQEDRDEAERKRVTDNKVNALNGEVYDMLNFAWRKKGSKLEQDSESKLDLRYILHGRHTQPGDAPLVTLAEC